MTAPSPTCSTTLHGEVSDPIGDVRAYPGAPNPPDLVHGTADVCGTNITFTVRLASGPFDATTTLLIIDLDTDQNSATGQSGGLGLGVDYLISMGDGQSNQAVIGQYIGPLNFGTVGNAPVTFVADGMNVTVPLSMIGSRDGRMNFRVSSFVHLPGTTTSGSLDDMPDAALSPGSVQ